MFTRMKEKGIKDSNNQDSKPRYLVNIMVSKGRLKAYY